MEGRLGKGGTVTCGGIVRKRDPCHKNKGSIQCPHLNPGQSQSGDETSLPLVGFSFPYGSGSEPVG